MKEIELIERRKVREKHFLQEDGTIIAKVYDNDVHFLKDGKYEEIDNQLIKENDYYVNKKNAYKVFFKENSKFDLMRMEKSSHYLDIKLKDEKETFLKKSKNFSKFMDYVKYEDILDNIDLEYKVLPSKVKESIIIKNKNNLPSKLDFIIDTNLQLILNDNKSISAKKDGETFFIIEAPYMVDSNNKLNNNIYYELFQNNGKYELSLKLDTIWLNREDIVYPITIDPTITNSGEKNNVYDTYIYEGDTNVDRNSQDVLKVGVEKVNNVDVIYRTLMKFELPTLGTGSQIISASINLFGYPYNRYSNQLDTVCVHQITSDWSENEANWENMHDKYNSRIETCIKPVRSFYIDDVITNLGYNYVNITSLVKKWYLDTQNYGIMLKAHKEVYKSDVIPAFFSKNNTVSNGDLKPVLIINYRNTNGLENYMNYQSHSFSQGSAHINTYNGNLTTVFDIGKTIGGKLPIQLNLVYNTNDVVLNNNYGYGLGCRLNLYQTIKEKNIDAILYLEYSDTDGTSHYFRKQDDIFKDEDGLGLSITKTDNECIMKDKNDNTMTFIKNEDIYYLKEIIDKSNNKITITHNSNNTISKIADNYNQEINLIYETNKILVISPSETTVLNYSNNQVISIAKNTGTTIFEYDSKLTLSKVIDENLKSVGYEYYEQIPYRIKKVTEYGIDNAGGAFFDVEYGFESTTIIDNKNRATTFVYNENGNIMSISNLKESEDVKNAYSKRESTGITDSKYKNKLLTSRIPIKYVNNLLTDTSFENSEVKFIPEDDVTLSIDEEFVKSGVKSLKVVNIAENKILSCTVSVPKGENYTFSTYLKNTNNIKLALSYLNTNNEVVENISEVIYENDDFMRYDVTINYPTNAISDLTIKIYLLKAGITYLDDIQLEEGEVANNYNIIENSNFSNGTTGWTLNASTFEGDETIVKDTKDYFEVITSSTGEKILKIKMDPEVNTSLNKSINISGKEGDLYNLSFWYKSDGINISDQGYSYNTVAFNFYDANNPDIGSGSLLSMPLNPNSKNWQYFSQNFVAPRDYTNFGFYLFQSMNANDLYITNISLFKDIREAYYDYDDNGNLTIIRGLDEEQEEFSYDDNNQLIKMTNPMGKNFTFEYDNDIITRPLKGLSPTGISNEIKYDIFGNPITSRTKYVGTIEEILNGIYTIRLKGTNKYLRNIANTLKLDEDNHDKWNLAKVDDYYKISHSIIGNKYLTSVDSNLLLKGYEEDNSLFTLTKNDNGSYFIKSKDTEKYLKNNNDTLIVSDLVENDPSFEFYFEIDNDNKFIESTAEYTSDGKFVKSTTDSNFNKTVYDIDDETGLTRSITNAKNQKTSYSYNDKKQLASVISKNKKILYNYNSNNLLDKITSGNKEYNFIYDSYLKMKQVKIGDNITLITNNYEENNGNLISSLYGNDHAINYSYDEFDRIKTLTKMDNTYNYKYNNNGDLTKLISNTETIKYTYDLAKRLHSYNTNNDFSINYTYDKNNNITNKVYNLDNIMHSIDKSFNDEDSLTNITIDDKIINYNYDNLGRLISKNINNSYTTNYKYLTNGKRTTLLINELDNNNDKLQYKYDKLNNITHIYNNDNLINKYYYDEFNELIREDNYILNKTIRYKYDTEGNILSKKEYQLNSYNLLSQNIYEYDDLNWEDKLTRFNNDSITYDNIGNPLTIGNNITLSWINGRELNSYVDSNYNISYKYNINGRRTIKTINGIETKYYLEGSKIIFEKTDNNVLYYIRNEVDDLVGFKYNDDLYYYVKNIQNDIIEILDSNYNIVCKYSYDSFGNILSITDNAGLDISNNTNHIANINPFRYRSYYYDKETKLYYLNSRYYNPLWGRFINADGYISTGYGAFCSNMYTYVNNNFISSIDFEGKSATALATFIKILGGAASGIAGQFVSDICSSVMEGEAHFSSWQNYAGAAVGGAIGSLGWYNKQNPVVTGIISSAVASTTTQSLEVLSGKKKINSSEFMQRIFVDTAIGTTAATVNNYAIKLDVPGITTGTGNYGSVYRAGITKVQKQITETMSLKTFSKGIIFQSTDDLFSSTMSGMMGYAEHQYDNYFNSPKVCWEVR